MMSMARRLEKYERLIIFSLFIISCVLKIIFIIPSEAPGIFLDELLYKENARYLLNLDYYSSQYPPLYSLILSLSFIIDANNFYVVMQIINVILSSLLVFPAWILAKKYLDIYGRLFVSCIVLIIPYQFVYPRFILSENLYYTLFVWLVYFTIISSEKLRYIDSIAMGIAISFCLMTRYMTYAILPFIVFIWITLSYFTMRDNGQNINQIFKEWIYKGSIIVLTTLVVSIPWILTRYSKGYPILEIFNDYSKQYVSSEGLENVTKWTVFYISNFILSICPLLLPLLYGLLDCMKNKFNIHEKKFIFTSLFFTIPILYIAIKHSATAYYNKEIPSYILGRYTTYVFLFWLIISCIIMKKISVNLSKIKLVTATVISQILIYLSYLTIIKGKFYKITDWFVMVHNAADSFSFKRGGDIFLISTIILLAISTVLLIIRQYKIYNCLLIFFFVASSLMCLNQLKISQKNILFNNSIVSYIKENANKVYVQQDDFYYNIKFWELEDKIIEYNNKTKIDISDGDIILSNDKLPLEVLFSHNSSYLYKYSKHEMRITKTYPDKINIGEKFNVQENGKSALAIKGEGFFPGCCVTINGEKIHTTFGSPEYLTIIVDDHYYEKRNDLVIKVVYNDLFESNEVIIPVR